MADAPLISIKHLEPSDDFRGFSLGEAEALPLKTFLLRNSKGYEANSICRTYVAVDDARKRVIGYVSVICGEVVLGDGHEPEHDGPVKFQYDHWPAIKIARLAVDRRYRGQDLGRTLVDLALGVAKEYICPNVGCRFAVLDAKQKSIGFYERCGFTMLDTEANRDRPEPVMFIDLAKA